jgi:IS6 family transposase
MILRHL